jgi:NADP-dependent 3-hydroxy acid dehydrogenase YdfG
VNQVIVISGASSGFGALTARALADAGHNVYAGMRNTTSRNADAVTQLSRYAASRHVELKPVEMDVRRRSRLTPPSRRSSKNKGASTWSSTTPDTW